MIRFEFDPRMAQWLERMTSPGLAAELVDEAILEIYPTVMANMPRVQSGATMKAMETIDWGAGVGVASGGIGDLEKVGDPFDAAPENTISQFIEWYHKNAGG